MFMKGMIRLRKKGVLVISVGGSILSRNSRARRHMLWAIVAAIFAIFAELSSVLKNSFLRSIPPVLLFSNRSSRLLEGYFLFP